MNSFSKWHPPLARPFPVSGIFHTLGLAFFLVCSSGLAQTQLVSGRSPMVSLPAGGNGDSSDPQISPDGRFVLFLSTATDLSAGAGSQLAAQVYLRDRMSNTTTLVSVNYNGTGGGNANSSWASMTPDGRYVVFQSDASDLVPGDTNGYSDVFLRDMQTGLMSLVSISTNGGFASGQSWAPSVTPDGRYVAFLSSATSLASVASGTGTYVYVRDLTAQATVQAAPGSGTVASTYPNPISAPQITPNGRYVVFATPGVNPVNHQTLSESEVYVYDLVANQSFWASSNALSVAQGLLGKPNLASTHPVISDDGSLVAFKTGLTNDSNPAVVFQCNLNNGTLTVVASNAISTPLNGNDIYGPEMTPDGRFIAFCWREGVFSASVFGSVRLWDSQTGTNTTASLNTNGFDQTNALSAVPAVSTDGRYVVFVSNATNLATNVTVTGAHLYRRDMLRGATLLLDADTNSFGSTDFTNAVPVISTNGQFIAFAGPDSSLVAGDTNGASDVFLTDATGGTVSLVSQRNSFVPVREANGLSFLNQLSISADGRWVAYASYASDLVTNDTNGLLDVFVYDRWGGSNILVSVATNGGPALGGSSYSPVISTNGRYVAFMSAATNLTANTLSTNWAYNIYRRDLQAQNTVLVSVSTNGVNTGDNDSSLPAMSQDGRFVAYYTTARVLAAGLTGASAVVEWDGNAGTNGVVSSSSGSGSSLTMSEDGRYVAFLASSSSINVWDTQQAKSLFTAGSSSCAISPDGTRLLYVLGPIADEVEDLVNKTNMVTLNGGQPIRGQAAWSGNGRYVVIVTSNSFSSLDANNLNDVYLVDLLTPATNLVSINSSLSASGGGASDWPAISWDGRYVVFRSTAPDLVSGYTNSPGVYLYDSMLGYNVPLFSSTPSASGSARSAQFGFSIDGSTVDFQSWDGTILPGAANRGSGVFAALSPYGLNIDSDGDGIPDWWTLQYFGHLAGAAYDQSLAQSDADGDGMSNWQEYIAGTDPTNPNSILLVQALPTPAQSGSVTLSWVAEPGKTYQLVYKDNLADTSWTTAPDAPTIIGNLGQFTISTGEPARFYQIEVH